MALFSRQHTSRHGFRHPPEAPVPDAKGRSHIDVRVAAPETATPAPLSPSKASLRPLFSTRASKAEWESGSGRNGSLGSTWEQRSTATATKQEKKSKKTKNKKAKSPKRRRPRKAGWWCR